MARYRDWVVDAVDLVAGDTAGDWDEPSLWVETVPLHPHHPFSIAITHGPAHRNRPMRWRYPVPAGLLALDSSINTRTPVSVAGRSDGQYLQIRREPHPFAPAATTSRTGDVSRRASPRAPADAGVRRAEDALARIRHRIGCTWIQSGTKGSVAVALSRELNASNRSGSGARNSRGRHRSDAVPREAETFRPFSPPCRRAHPPGPEQMRSAMLARLCPPSAYAIEPYVMNGATSRCSSPVPE